jgi:hypothetical protein
MAKLKKEISTYLRPLDNKLLTAYCYVHRTSKSRVLEVAVRQIFSNMKEFEIQQLIKIYDGMTDDERKYPKSF